MNTTPKPPRTTILNASVTALADVISGDIAHKYEQGRRLLTIAHQTDGYGKTADYARAAVKRVMPNIRTTVEPGEKRSPFDQVVKGWGEELSRARRIVKYFDDDLADALNAYEQASKGRGGKLALSGFASVLFAKPAADKPAADVADSQDSTDEAAATDEAKTLLEVVLAALPNLTPDERTVVAAQLDMLGTVVKVAA